MADNKRFEIVYSEPPLTKATQIIVDKVTGVNYLWHADGYGGGLTPLLDADGKPVVTLIKK